MKRKTWAWVTIAFLAVTVGVAFATLKQPYFFASNGDTLTQAELGIAPCIEGQDTPCDKEIPMAPMVPSVNAVDVPAGTAMTMAILTQQNTLAPGGKWEAEEGTFEGDTYTSPEYLPPSHGVDVLTYTDPNGMTATVNVVVKENPDIPGSGEFKIVWNDPMDLTDHSIYDRANFPGATVVDIGQPVPVPPSLDGSQEIPLEGFGDFNGYRIPANLEGSYSEDCVAVKENVVRKPSTFVTLNKGMLNVGLNDPPPGSCRQGDQAWSKSGVTTRFEYGTWKDMGNHRYHITTSIAAILKKIFNIDLGVNVDITVRVWARDVERRQVYFIYYYKCQNGKWVRIGTKRCIREGNDVITIPAWARIFLGFPPKGPIWQDWICNPA
jgi:hypothetical protein